LASALAGPILRTFSNLLRFPGTNPDTAYHVNPDGREYFFLQRAPVAIVLCIEGRIVFANTACLRLFGATDPGVLVGHPLVDRVAEGSREVVAAHFSLPTKSASDDDFIELDALKMDGSEFPCRITLTRLPMARGSETIAFFFDHGAQREAQRVLAESRKAARDLAAHLLQAREEERRAVAREIHDELGQSLAALKMGLKWIDRRHAPLLGTIDGRWSEVLELSDQVIKMVHRISTELRPSILDDLGLPAALEWLGGEFSRRNGIPCHVDIANADVGAMAGRNTTALFRIVQEALSNVARHAQATRAFVELWDEDKVLHVRIRDDGRGVSEAELRSSQAFGLIGIRERVERLPGTMSIVGKPGQGTILTVWMPVSEQVGRDDPSTDCR
jgi:PAS domain S-box-containing protein